LKFISSDTYNFLKSKLLRSYKFASSWHFISTCYEVSFTRCEGYVRDDHIMTRSFSFICYLSKRYWLTCQGEEVGNVCCLLVNFKAGRTTSERTVAVQRSDVCCTVWNSNVVRIFTSCWLYGMLCH